MSQGRLRTFGASASALAATIGIAGALWSAAHPKPRGFACFAQVPGAGALLGSSVFEQRADGSLVTKPPVLSSRRERRSFEAVAPALASGVFKLGGAQGGHDLTLEGARPERATIRNGAGIYEDAYAATDVVVTSTPQAFELSYLVRENREQHYAFRVALREGESFRTEPSSGALLLGTAGSSPRLRIGTPIAMDSAGRTRTGSYRIEGDTIHVELELRDLRAPLVIDPTFAFPVWTITSDARGPGSEVYNVDRLSTETHFVSDTARGRLIGIRPVRSQQVSDTLAPFAGDPNGGVSPALVDPTLRPTPQTPAAPGDAEIGEWLRGYALESETWEWDGSSWALAPTAHLPGLIDPALGFDPSRNRTVLYGGAPPGPIECAPNIYGIVSCRDKGYLDLTYEYDGHDWVAHRITGSPPPRIRGSMAFDPTTQRTILFGGRALPPDGSAWATSNRDAVFPETLAQDLVNDTWAYDGATWQRIPSASPPSAREGAQLILDAARKVIVLVGGHTAAQRPGLGDELDIWEFDGTDWTQKVRFGDASLPRSLRTRRGATAFWNPVRGRVVIEAGTSEWVDACSLSDEQLQQAIAGLNGASAEEKRALAQTGCLGGFVHDSWEWDGTALVRVADVAFGGFVADQAVFEQVAGASTWIAQGAAGDASPSMLDGGSALLPWRYDNTSSHFHLRSVLERSHAASATGPVYAPPGATQTPSTPPSNSALVSPLFATYLRGYAFFDASRSVAQLFDSDGGNVRELDGAGWADHSPSTSPFASGTNEFFAAAWDSVSQRIVLFDPTSGATWTYTDTGGWARLGVPGPTAWLVDPSVHVVAKATEAQLLLVPHMTFDRLHNLIVMVYQGSLWRFDGGSWISDALPTPDCVSAVQLEFDSSRGSTILVGCTVPAQTWEFDGASWSGPGPSPYTASIERDPSRFATPWQGSLQLRWMHPNSIFDSPALGGISVVDADGTIRTWTGATWSAGPAMPAATNCFGRSIQRSSVVGTDLAESPMCLSPPGIADTANNRLIAFRSGPAGMLRLSTDVEATSRAWGPLEIGEDPQFATRGTWGPDAYGKYTIRVNPYPFELVSAEVARLTTQSDPTTDTKIATSGLDVGFQEKLVTNLFWPYRLLRDPDSGAVRLLTHRGLVWQLGSERALGPGETCSSDADCFTGGCSRSEGVCCDNPLCGNEACVTCKGPNAGVCSPMAVGQRDPTGACGVGECAGVCPGFGFKPYLNQCLYDASRSCGAASSCAQGVLRPGGHCAPTSPACIAPDAPLPTCPQTSTGPALAAPCVLAPQACANGLGCSSTGACETQCSTRADCTKRSETCTADGSGCTTDQAGLAAAQLGIATASIDPPPLRSNEDIANLMLEAGFTADDAGVIDLTEINNIGFQFDPHEHSINNGIGLCLDRIEACMILNRSIDECVAATPRCVTSMPWLGDPAGDDCCPESCLLEYFTRRKTTSDEAALRNILTSSCYGDDSDGGTR